MHHLVLTYSHTNTHNTQTHRLMPICTTPSHTLCLASSAEGRLDARVGNASHYSLVRWPKGEMKNSPVVLILKTLNTLILSSSGALLLASSAAMATSGYKTISGFVVKGAWMHASEIRNTQFTSPQRDKHVVPPWTLMFYHDYNNQSSFNMCCQDKNIWV